VEEIIRREQRPGGSGASLHLLMQAGDRLAQIAQTTLAPTPLATTPEGITVPAPPTPDDDAPLRPKAPAHAPVVICEGLTHDVLARCDFAITKSGTSTLEAAILQKPMVVVYRGSGLMEIEWALRKSSLKIDYISMPNILAGEMLVPELIQENATAETISTATLGILLDPARLIQLKSRLADLIKESLGEPGGIHRSAELLLGLIEERKAVRQ